MNVRHPGFIVLGCITVLFVIISFCSPASDSYAYCTFALLTGLWALGNACGLLPEGAATARKNAHREWILFGVTAALTLFFYWIGYQVPETKPVMVVFAWLSGLTALALALQRLFASGWLRRTVACMMMCILLVLCGAAVIYAGAHADDVVARWTMWICGALLLGAGAAVDYWDDGKNLKEIEAD